MVKNTEVEIYEVAEGFSRARPLPTKEELREFYTNTYYQEGHGRYKDKYDTKKHNDILYKLHKKIFLLLSLFVREKENFLDIGCGQGYALKTFSANGWEVTGLDYTSRACSIHHPDMIEKIIEGDLYETLGALDTQYQVVHADNVLEHVLDPYEMLELCKKVLKPGGILIIDVPNENSKFQKWLLEKGAISRMFEQSYPDHLSFFNLVGLRNLCNKAGFRELFIGDFSKVHMVINGIRIEIDEYISSLPINKSLRYYCTNADLGFGPELMGFFTVDP